MTRLLVCGGRNYTDYWTVHEVLNGFHKSRPVECLIEGGALGADRFARRWAHDHGLHVETYEADWSLGLKGGPIRNRRMIVEGKPGHVIAFPGGKGTANMIDQAERAGIPITRIE